MNGDTVGGNWQFVVPWRSSLFVCQWTLRLPSLLPRSLTLKRRAGGRFLIQSLRVVIVNISSDRRSKDVKKLSRDFAFQRKCLGNWWLRRGTGHKLIFRCTGLRIEVWWRILQQTVRFWIQIDYKGGLFAAIIWGNNSRNIDVQMKMSVTLWGFTAIRKVFRFFCSTRVHDASHRGWPGPGPLIAISRFSQILCHNRKQRPIAPANETYQLRNTSSEFLNSLSVTVFLTNKVNHFAVNLSDDSAEYVYAQDRDNLFIFDSYLFKFTAVNACPTAKTWSWIVPFGTRVHLFGYYWYIKQATG